MLYDEYKGALLYENALAKQESIKDFVLEGQAVTRFDGGCLCLENADPAVACIKDHLPENSMSAVTTLTGRFPAYSLRMLSCMSKNT